ncbi:MAG: hypothetical protein HYU64_16170 [Armatimonadetes bacterium]|nr:hypothetical protein [Armatimonadota bacterium]
MPIVTLVLGVLCLATLAAGMGLQVIVQREGAPHLDSWMKGHKSLEPSSVDATRCWSCHKQEVSCLSCHKKSRLKYHGLQAEWRRTHGEESKKQYCSQCHTRKSCRECHKKDFTHPPSLMKTHVDYTMKVGARILGQERPEAAVDTRSVKRAGEQSCDYCHKRSYCTNCHSAKKVSPPVHPKTWPASHAVDPKARAGQCGDCHQATSCRSCHLKKKPGSHQATWMSLHGTAYREKRSDCRLCHEEKQCLTCHKTKGPPSHVSGWKLGHGKARLRSGAQYCQKCHLQKICDNCHKLSMPHPVAWRQEHPDQAHANRAVCNTCHEIRRTCIGCHKVPIPHPKSWMGKEHGLGQIKLIKQGVCLQCHRGGQDCQNCHRLAMPHPRDWLKVGHKAAKDYTPCFMCHKEQPEMCMKCHRKHKVLPVSHKDEQWKPRLHKLRTGIPGEDESCKLCHGTNACIECHKVRLPHTKAWIGGGHKDERLLSALRGKTTLVKLGEGPEREHAANFAPDVFCFKCHKNPKMCKICHKGKMKWKLSPEGLPVPVETPTPTPTPSPEPSKTNSGSEEKKGDQ